MATRHSQGGASALPIARSFIATGGRLLVSPTGKLETGIDTEKVFGSTGPKEARRGFVMVGAFTGGCEIPALRDR